MKETLKLGFILCVICAVAAGALSFTNQLTFQARLDAKIKAEKDALQIVHQNADKFEPSFLELKQDENTKGLLEKLGIKPVQDGENKGKLKVFSAKDKQGNFLGIAFQIQPRGFSGPVKLMVGISDKLEISGIKVLSHQETPGLGAKIQEINMIVSNKLINDSKTPDETWIKSLKDSKKPWFLAQFEGRNIEELELDKDNSKIKDPVDSITASTISSRAVIYGVKNGLKLYSSLQNKGGK